MAQSYFFQDSHKRLDKYILINRMYHHKDSNYAEQRVSKQRTAQLAFTMPIAMQSKHMPDTRISRML